MTYKYHIFKTKMNIDIDDDDDDMYPGKLLHQAALYLNVDLLKVIVNKNRYVYKLFCLFILMIGSSDR